jgi:hypothetical protein
MKKKFSTSLLILAAFIFLTGCGSNLGFLSDKDRTVTNIELGSKNFTVLSRVSGTSSATYYLGFGGMKNKDLLEMAMTDLLSKANLEGGPRALANQLVDVHVGGFPLIYTKITVKISAHVIEFID